MTAVFHAYPGCSTCRSARRWLDEHGVAYREIDISVTPPSAGDLRNIRNMAKVPVRRLFNTSGQVYRAGNYAARLADMDDDAAFAELAANGMLIRRPLLVLGETAVVGFRAEEYAEALAASNA
ncbi:MAG TPA: Spx/MgsR family RNA polymerase-binding regulatory protein [Nannocystis sp.]